MKDEKSYVYFALKGEEFNPQNITDKLGIKPTVSWKKGDKRKYNNELKYSCWQLSSKIGKVDFEINSLINEIIEKLSDKVETINELKVKLNLNSVLEIILYIDTNPSISTPYLGHDLKTIDFLSQTNTIIDVDIYRFNSLNEL